MRSRFIVVSLLLATLAKAEPMRAQSLILPAEGWFKSAYPGIELMALAPDNVPGTYHENISVVLKPASYKTVPDMNKFIAPSADAVAKLVADFSLVSKGATTIGDAPGFFLEYTGNFQGMKLRWVQYSLLRQNSWYIVTFVGDEAGFLEVRPQVESILAGVRFD